MSPKRRPAKLIDLGGYLVEADKLIDLGAGHYLEPTTCHGHPGDGVTGYIETHPRKDGDGPDPCTGGISLRGHGHGTRGDGSPRPEWNRTGEDPLTLTPSILCRVCGAHGFVTAGRWVDS